MLPARVHNRVAETVRAVAERREADCRQLAAQAQRVRLVVAVGNMVVGAKVLLVRAVGVAFAAVTAARPIFSRCSRACPQCR